jgi:hypothetical protein
MSVQQTLDQSEIDSERQIANIDDDLASQTGEIWQVFDLADRGSPEDQMFELLELLQNRSRLRQAGALVVPDGGDDGVLEIECHEFWILADLTNALVTVAWDLQLPCKPTFPRREQHKGTARLGRTTR